MKYLFFISIFGFIVACGNKSEKEEQISFEDLVGETGVLEDKDTIEVKDSAVSVPQTKIDQFIVSQMSVFDTATVEKFHPIDRFSFNRRVKVEFKSREKVNYDEIEVNPRVKLHYYTFSDTAKTKNALYNWLDCFGEDCQMINLNQDTTGIKTPPIFAVVYDTLILALNYRCEDRNYNWNPFQDSLLSQFGYNYNYRLKVACGGPLTWGK
ncbi:hypothetical protein [Crocinitomix algicola]|uniref:hypothetical protein n=1 Tax=Crocinitomix algicola TaxID=1740263 RepID=UPI001112D912|nr:hypothetical protein [Crocinitomix algicola]